MTNRNIFQSQKDKLTFCVRNLKTYLTLIIETWKRSRSQMNLVRCKRLRLVPLVEQNLPTFLTTWDNPRFWWSAFCSAVVLYCSFLNLSVFLASSVVFLSWCCQFLSSWYFPQLYKMCSTYVLLSIQKKTKDFQKGWALFLRMLQLLLISDKGVLLHI